MLDADVLYGLPLRDTLLSAAAARCFQPAWSERILEETFRNLLDDRRIGVPAIGTLRAALSQHFEDAMVTGFERLIDRMPNHPKDRHVAACAVRARAALIVTGNTRDFANLPHGLVAVTPDDFLTLLLTRTPARLAIALAAQAARLTRPPMTVADVLERLRTVAPGFVRRYETSFHQCP